MTPNTPLAVTERAALADALDGAGPGAPTLCAGWTTSDLAAHLVIREGRPLVGLSRLVPPLSARAEKALREVAAGDYRLLVRRFRTGPPALSPFRIGRLDAAANGVEYFVHHEDVRRATPGGSAPRPLPDAVQDQLWDRLGLLSRLGYRRSPVAVELVTPDGRRRQAHGSGPGVQIRGLPAELLLYSAGRRAVAEVTLDGDPSAVRQLAGLTLRM